MLDLAQKNLAVPSASSDTQVANDFPEFTDLYLPECNPEYGVYYPGPSALSPDMGLLAKELVEIAIKRGVTDFAAMSHGIPFRGHKMQTIGGTYFNFRRMPTKIWTLDDCGIKGPIAKYILSDRLSKGGLIIVSGMPGNGKSTTCAAIVVDRLKEYSGLCITVEDPVEMPLQGFHGDGLCLQKNLVAEQEFHAAVRDAMRAYPAQANTMMLIGEVRDAETAALALRSSVDGRLVMITIHAGSIVQAVQRIITLASDVLGVSEARSLLANSIRLVMNQKLVDKRLRVTTLFDTQPVAGIIMSKDVPVESLKNEIQSQMNRLKLKMEIKPRNLED